MIHIHTHSFVLLILHWHEENSALPPCHKQRISESPDVEVFNTVDDTFLVAVLIIMMMIMTIIMIIIILLIIIITIIIMIIIIIIIIIITIII